METIIKSTSASTCELDALPTPILKKCLPELLPPITNIVNLSLQSGTVTSEMKKSIMVPRLKKADLSSQSFSRYRPISNINYLSKITEKAVIIQVHDHLLRNELYAETQSAYRPHHSVETALVRLQNDILIALDQRKEVILILLDFSAAFDTVDHLIMIERLSKRFG